MPNYVEFGKGTATDEQDLVRQIDNFIVGICGWTRIDVVSDTASDVDYVYFSEGTEPGRFRHLYARWRGYSNYLYTYMYSRWGSSIDYDGELFWSDHTQSETGTTTIDWWGFGDADGVWIAYKNGSNSNYYSNYAGYYDSYYPDDEDDLPILAIGQRYNNRFYNGNRIVSYCPYDEMFAPGTTSGTSRTFKVYADQYNSMLTYHDPSDRDGTDMGHIPFVIYNSEAGGRYEVKGELKHCLQFSGASFTSEDWYTISGTEYKYFIKKYGDYETEGFGPVITSSGTDW